MSSPVKTGNWDHWIPRAFIVFFLGLAGLELWFVTLATRTFSGLVTDHAYATGLNDTDMIAQRQIEADLGWTADLGFMQHEGRLQGDLTLSLRSRDGNPLIPDEIRATAEKMSRHPQIQAVDFTILSEGLAKAELRVPLAGRWFVRLRIGRGQEAVHLIREIDITP